MIPETIPVFKSTDIIKPPAERYEDGDKKSTVGWLKHLYLWRHDSKYAWPQRDSDRKDYEEAVRKFRVVNNIPKTLDLHEWEDTTTVTNQAKALNKFRIEEGYTDVN